MYNKISKTFCNHIYNNISLSMQTINFRFSDQFFRKYVLFNIYLVGMKKKKEMYEIFLFIIYKNLIMI